MCNDILLTLFLSIWLLPLLSFMEKIQQFFSKIDKIISFYSYSMNSGILVNFRVHILFTLVIMVIIWANLDWSRVKICHMNLTFAFHFIYAVQDYRRTFRECFLRNQFLKFGQVQFFKYNMISGYY